MPKRLGAESSRGINKFGAETEIESVSRDMCFALHRKRVQLLDINSYILSPCTGN